MILEPNVHKNEISEEEQFESDLGCYLSTQAIKKAMGQNPKI